MDFTPVGVFENVDGIQVAMAWIGPKARYQEQYITGPSPVPFPLRRGVKFPLWRGDRQFPAIVIPCLQGGEIPPEWETVNPFKGLLYEALWGDDDE